MKLTLSEKLEVLKTLDAEILDLVEEGDMAEEIDQADKFKEKMYAVMVRNDRVLNSTYDAIVRPMPTATSSTPSAGGSAPARSGSQVKLPKLNIQPFRGDLTTRTPFWESYRAAIHDYTSLNDADKFSYLRSLLEHTALDAISGLSLTGPNYHEAISILEKRFGNKQRIISKHMDALMNLEAVTSSNNLKALRRLYDQVELHTRSLKSLGVESSSYGGLLASVLLNKLPQLFVSCKIGEREWKLDEIMRVVEEELGARERTTAIAVNSIKKHTREPPTAAALFTRGASGVSCTYCQQAHSSNSCQVVSHPNACKQVLQKAGRCFVCLRRGHISRECRSQGRCPKCGGKHHGSICSKGTDSSNAIPSVPDRSGNTTAASQSRANLSVPSTASR